MKPKTRHQYPGKNDKACIPSGYAYELDAPGSSWKSAKQDDWDTVMLSKKHCGRILGFRTIDGSSVRVLRVRGKTLAVQNRYLQEFRGVKSRRRKKR